MAIPTYQDTSVFPITEGQKSNGITLREYVASMALQGIIAHERVFKVEISPEDAARKAITFTDALLTELFKTQRGSA